MINWHNKYDIRQGTYSSDFRMCNPFDGSRGDTYTDVEQSWTNLMSHESLFEIYDTLSHEAEHVALKRENMTDEIEHMILRRLHQVLYGIIDL